MPIVDGQALQRTYGTHRVLDQVDVTIDVGERVGLLGDNGSGKSTLGRILGGVEAPDGGVLHVRRGARVVYLEQSPEFDPGLSARDAVLSGLPAWLSARDRYDAANGSLARDDLSEAERELALQTQAEAAAELERSGGWDLSHRADAVLGHMGVADPDRSVANMSGGELRRVALARLLVAEPDLAILDEPTNHLDVATIEWLENHLANAFKGAVLLITHDRYVLDRVVHRTLELSAGTLYAYDGGYSAFLEGKAERQAHEARTEANRQNFLRRELEWLRRGPKARGTKQKARIERAQAALAQDAPAVERQLDMQLSESRGGKTVLELHDVTLRQGERTLMQGLTLYMSKGERLGILGPNGCGKTTLLRAVLGEHACAAGRIVLGKNVDVAYLSQGRDGLDPNGSVLDNVAGGQLVVRYGGQDQDVRGYLQRFFFDATRQRQPVGSLSGGERTRVALAKLLCHDANLIILDEPTNDLDVSTLGALEEMLQGFAGSALVVTHDRYFMDRIATAVLATEGDGAWTRYAGNYSDYLAQRPRAGKSGDGGAGRSGKTRSGEGARTQGERADKPRPKGLTYGERLELEKLPGRIEDAETQVSELEAQLADPELYRSRSDEVGGLQAQLAAAQTGLQELYARWEALEEKKAATDA